PYVRGLPAEAVRLLGLARVDVSHDAHAVAEPVRTAPLDGLPDRWEAERLAGVDREVEVLPLQVLERVQMPGRRIARLGAGDVEADHADVPEANGELGDLGGASGVAHGGEQRADPDRGSGLPRRCRTGLKAGEDSLDH